MWRYFDKLAAKICFQKTVQIQRTMLGGGAGTIMDMIMRLRANKNLLRKRSLFKKDKSFFAEDRDDLKTPHTKLVYKTPVFRTGTPKLKIEDFGQIFLFVI